MATTASRGTRVVDDWESKILLDDKQKESILLLQEACTDRPFPSNLHDDDDEEPASAYSGAGSVFHTPPIETASSAPPWVDASTSATQLGLSEPIETTQQFFNWFSNIEVEMEKGQEDIYRAYLATVHLYRKTCDDILENIDTTSSLLEDLQANYKFVEDKTKALQQACEKLLEDQNHLLRVAEDLASRLEYFNELEPVTKLFSAPGETVCLDERFIPMLQRLDECILFVSTHLRYRDSELYLMRFRQCMTRGMSLIKLYVVNTLRSTLNDIREKIAAREQDSTEPLSPSMQLSLFYVKFRTLAPKLKFLIEEIEARCEGHVEYYALLGDCYKTYFYVRQTLLNPYILAQIQTITTDTDVLTASRSGCAYMMRLCADEYSLFFQYFDLGEEELVSYLESLSSSLYDALRPIILREVRIDTLSELCQTLHIYLKSTDMVPDAEAEDEEENNPVMFVAQKILEDAQQRLVFRAQGYVEAEIGGFRPREEELEVLARGRGLPQPTAIQTHLSVAPVLGAADNEGPAMLQVEEEGGKDEEEEGDTPTAIALGKLVYGGGEWYPTVQRTLYILGKLYRCVPNSIFEDLAQEAVDLCRHSLVGAADIIAGKQTKLDGQFFLIKNLLMLREQIAPFDVNFVRKEEVLEFSGLRDAVTNIMQSRWGIGALASLGYGIMSAAAPSTVESFSDAKQLVDKELKRVCEEFIVETAKGCVDVLSGFLAKVAAYQLKSEAQPNAPLHAQAFATGDTVIQLYKDFLELMQTKMIATTTKMADYLGDRKTEGVLVGVVKSNILDTYQRFWEVVRANYGEDVRGRIESVEEVKGVLERACKSKNRGVVGVGVAGAGVVGGGEDSEAGKVVVGDA